jgi:signal transduction histidine kinase
MAIIEISNSGPPIANNHLPHIFEPFYTTKPAGKGAGLNLSSAYAIVTGYNGHITVSNLANGVMFRINIPIKSTIM